MSEHLREKLRKTKQALDAETEERKQEAQRQRSEMWSTEEYDVAGAYTKLADGSFMEIGGEMLDASTRAGFPYRVLGTIPLPDDE